MDNNQIIKHLIELTKELARIKDNVEDLQLCANGDSKKLFDYTLYLLKECINEISKIGFEIK